MDSQGELYDQQNGESKNTYGNGNEIQIKARRNLNRRGSNESGNVFEGGRAI